MTCFRTARAHPLGAGTSTLGYDKSDVLHRLRYLTPSHTFRDIAEYSNMGYFAVGQIVAALGGKEWQHIVRTRLIEPLGMKRTGFLDNLNNTNVAHAHATLKGKTTSIPWNRNTIMLAVGGITSSVNDLAKYVSMLLAEGTHNGIEIIKPQVLEEMFVPTMAAAPSFAELPPITVETGFSYGLGWGNYHWKNQQIIEKNGAHPGMRSIATLVPEMNLGIVVLSNMNVMPLPESVRAYVLEQYLGEAEYDVQEAIKNKLDAVMEHMHAEKLKAPIKPEPLSLPAASYAGTYGNDYYGDFTVVDEGEKLRIDAGPAKVRGALTHFNLDSFMVKWSAPTSAPDLVVFETGPEGTVTGFNIKSFGNFKRK